MARLTLNLSTRDTTPLKAMEMVITPMVIGTMVETRETTPMVTIMEAIVTTLEAMETITEEMEITMEAMAIRMEEIVNTVTTRELTGIFRISPVSNAKKTGHFANDCPKNKQDAAAKPNPFKKGHVNHINVEEMMGTFPLNSFTTLDFI
jgi:hypothetical protein